MSNIDLKNAELIERVIDQKIQNAIQKYLNSTSIHRGVKVLYTDNEDVTWVKIPGGADETPVDIRYADVSPGDMVTLRFENGNTIIEGNVSNVPISTSNYEQRTERAILMATDPINSTLKSITADLGQFKILKADYAEIAELVAQKATIEDLTVTNEHVQNLVAENVTINNRLDANEANITTLTADNATINGKLTAAEADIENLQAADATITGRLTAAEGVIDNLDSNYAHITNGVIDNATIGHADVNGLNANYAHIANGAIDNATIDQARVNNLSTYYAHITNGEIDNAMIDHADVNGLSANYATIANLNAEKARIDTIESNYVTTAVLNADIATINNLIAGKASVADLEAATADIDDLKATKADISLLESDYITTAVIEANYAKTDFSNATAAWIQNGVIKNGAITNAMINDVSADKLTAGTIDASKINVTNLQAKNISVEKINGVSVSGKSVADALTQHESDISDLDSKIDDEVDALNDRIDGAIETFTGTAVPTLSNSPASSWTVSGDSTATNKNYAAHVGDVYYVVNDQIPQNGYCYRFAYIDNSYQWQLIKDSDVTAALRRLQTAENDIDGLETRTATIEQFDEEIATFKTETKSELSTLMTRTTTLETNVTTAQSTANGALVENVQLWFTKANATAPDKPSSHVSSTATAGNTWTTKVPVYNASYPHYYYCYEYKKADGSYAWSEVVHDEAMCESQAQGRKGVSDAAAAKAIADKNVKSSIQLWFTKANDTAPSKPSVQIVSTATTGNAWTTRVPAYNSSYPKYFYCYQYELADGTYAWSDVVEDKAMAEVQSTSRTAASNASSALTQLTTKVETSVFNEVKQTVDENSNSITTLNTTTQQLRTDVDGKASQSDLTSLTTTVNTVKQTADTNKASITSLNTTTQTLREDLDGLEIGGRNLLKGRSTSNSWTSNGLTFEYDASTHICRVYGTNTHTGSNGWSIGSYSTLLTEALVPGEEYTLTVYDLGGFYDSNLYAQLNTYINTGSQVGDWSVGKTRHYPSHTNTVRSTYASHDLFGNMFVGIPADLTGSIDVSFKLKFEKGNRATDWTPAPEDTETSITEIRTTTTNKFNEVEQTLDGIETSIGEIQNDLDEKADGSTVSTLTSRVNTISDTVDGHTQTIQSVQETVATKADGSTVSSLSTKVNKIETDIIQTNREITISAASTLTAAKEYTDGEISTEVEHRNAAISTMSDSITASVARTYTTKTEFDNLQVGGRNLVRLSDKFRAGSVQSSTTMTQTVTDEGYYKIVLNNNSGNYNASWYAVQPDSWALINDALSEDDDYTVSFIMRAEGNTKKPKFYMKSGLDYYDLNGDISENWSIVWHTRQWKEANAVSPHLGWGSIANGTYYIKAWKIEKGNKPTDWTPAPEDIETRVTSAEAAISVNANNISSKVSSTDYNGNTIATLINQSADSVKIQANHLMIDGTTVFGTNSTLAAYLGSNYDAKGAASAVDSKLTNLNDGIPRTGGLCMRVNATNYDGAPGSNNGECGFYGMDANYAPAKVNGWVIWNGSKVTIPKGYWINPDQKLPYGVLTYCVYRTSNSTFYGVYYDTTLAKWRAAPYTSSMVTGTVADFTWVDATDIILASYVEPSSEAALTGATLFDPPKHFSEIDDPDSTNAIVDVYPTAVDYVSGTATLAVRLTVNGVEKTPTSRVWTKGPSQTAISGATGATLNVTDLNDIYNCKVTW